MSPGHLEKSSVKEVQTFTSIRNEYDMSLGASRSLCLGTLLCQLWLPSLTYKLLLCGLVCGHVRTEVFLTVWLLMSPTPGALRRSIEQRMEEEGDGPSRFPAPPFLKQQQAVGSSLLLVPAYEFMQHPQARPTLILSRFLIPNIVIGINDSYLYSKLYVYRNPN